MCKQLLKSEVVEINRVTAISACQWQSQHILWIEASAGVIPVQEMKSAMI